MSRDADTGEHTGWSWSRCSAVVLAVAVVGSMLAVAPATTAAQEDSQTFIIEQGDTCVQVTPLGNGSRTVEAFYDYRSTVTEPEGLYSSYGTTDIQKSQVSQVFIYRGSEGLSLVFLHDKFGDEQGGFVATADISGLPPEGEWPVEDDTYNNRDDVFSHSNGSSHIEWASNGNRTDGAAFRGLRSANYTSITVDMQFNEDSSRYPFEGWDGSPEQNQIERWIVRSGTGETTQLDMSEPIQISPGTCSGGVSTFTATPTGSGTTTATTAPTPTTESTAVMTTTATATPSPTATTTATPTATPSPTETTATTSTATPTTTESSAATQTTTTASSAANETTATTETGGQAETPQAGGDGGGSGVFGPGFGIGLALVAVMALAAVALARRNN